MNLEIINTGMKDFILSLWGMTNVNQMPFPQCALVLRLYRWDWSSVYNLLSTRTKYIEMQLCQDANTHSVFWGAFLHGLQDFLLTLVNNESFPRTVYLIDKWPEPLVPGVNISAFRIMDRKSQGHSHKWGPGLLSSTALILMPMGHRLIILTHFAVYKVPLYPGLIMFSSREANTQRSWGAEKIADLPKRFK